MMNRAPQPIASLERQGLSDRFANYEGAVLLLLALVTGSLWRFWGLGRPSFWLDEFITYWIISADTWGEFWIRSTSYAATPPLFFALEKLVLSFSGFDEFWLRVPAAALDLLAIVMLFGFVRECAGGRAAGISALIYAWNTSLVYHARIARPYSLAILLAELSMWVLWRALRQPERTKLWILYIVVTAGLIYSQFIFAPLLLAQVFWVALSQRREFRRCGPPMAVSLLAIGLSGLPLLGQALRLWSDRASLLWATASPGAERIAQFFQPGAVVVAGLGWLVVWWNLRKRNQNVEFQVSGEAMNLLGFLLVWALVPTVLMWGLSVRSHATLSETRYLLAYAPACAAIVGLVASWIRAAPTRVFVLLLYLVASPQVDQIRELIRQGYATLVTYDYRPALEKVARESTSADLVLVRTGMPETRLLDQRWSDLTLHGYLAAPLSVIPRSIELNVRALPDHWSEPETARHLPDLLVKTAQRGGSVWVICHDGLGAGNPLCESVGALLRRRGWTLMEAQFLEGELVAVYRIVRQETPQEPDRSDYRSQDGLRSDPPLPIDQANVSGDPVGFIRIKTAKPLSGLVIENGY